MRCIACSETAEGYAVIPGVGEAGEVRFYCDSCARRDRVKMRYWDGRDLDVGGHRDSPDLGSSFATLIISFEDFARMRIQDIALVMEWVEDGELAAALRGASSAVQHRILSSLRPDKARRVRELLGSGGRRDDPREAQERILHVLRRL